MPWTFVIVRLGELLCTGSDQSDLAEFGGVLDHWPGERSGDGVG